MSETNHDTTPVIPIGVACDVQLGKMVQPRPSTSADRKFPYVHAANIRPGGRLDLKHSHKLMYFSPKEASDYAIKQSDVLIVEGGKVGQPAFVTSDLDGYGFQNSILRLRPYCHKSHGRYIYYAMMEAVNSGRVEVSVDSVSIPHFTAEKVGRFRIPLPPLPTQRAIADYLDRETAEIDGMRTDLDEMERLLTERRIASFNATIRGRTTTEVKISVASQLITGNTPEGGGIRADNTVLEGIPWLRPDDLYGNKTQPSTRLTEEQALSVKVIPARTPLVCGIGSVGKVGILNEPCSTNQQITALVPNPGFDGDYLFRAVEASQDGLLATAAENVIPILNNLRMGMFMVPYVELSEQRRIADEIDRETPEIDSMLEDITKLRDLLAERRAALISAAVTGQIDIPVSPTHKDEDHV